MKYYLIIICSFLPMTVLAGDPPFSITQNNDAITILDEHTVACETENDRFLRRFFLNADHGLSAVLNISDIGFAVEITTAPITLTINLYSIDIGDPFLVSNMTPIGATTFDVTSMDNLQPISVALPAIIDGGLDDLVVEISVPDLNNGVLFLPGSNDAGQIGPSYLIAPDCAGNSINPVDIGTLKFPEVHIIMTVDGTITGPTADIIFVDGFDALIP